MSEPRDTATILLKRQRMLADSGDVALQSEDLDAVLIEACHLVAEALSTRQAKVLEMAPLRNLTS